MLCFYGAEIYCPNLIDLITNHFNHCHQKLYMVEYMSNFITYNILQQINGSNPSNSNRYPTKYTGNMISKLLKLVLNRSDLAKMVDTKKMRHFDTFPTVYHLHCLNIPHGNRGTIIRCPSHKTGGQ